VQIVCITLLDVPWQIYDAQLSLALPPDLGRWLPEIGIMMRKSAKQGRLAWPARCERQRKRRGIPATLHCEACASTPKQSPRRAEIASLRSQ